MASLADVIAAHTALMTGVTVHLGEEFIQGNDAPPRLIWVPTQETYQSAGRVTKASSSSVVPRSRGTRVAGVDVHIWAAGAQGDTTPYKDLRATELLLDRTIVYLRQVAQGFFTINGGRWEPVSANLLGRLYILSLLFSLPIVPAAADETTTTTTFTGVDVDPRDGTSAREGTMHLPSGDVTGKPSP